MSVKTKNISMIIDVKEMYRLPNIIIGIAT